MPPNAFASGKKPPV
jgi:hypothetical protein